MLIEEFTVSSYFSKILFIILIGLGNTFKWAPTYNVQNTVLVAKGTATIKADTDLPSGAGIPW